MKTSHRIDPWMARARETRTHTPCRALRLGRAFCVCEPSQLQAGLDDLLDRLDRGLLEHDVTQSVIELEQLEDRAAARGARRPGLEQATAKCRKSEHGLVSAKHIYSRGFSSQSTAHHKPVPCL